MLTGDTLKTVQILFFQFILFSMHNEYELIQISNWKSDNLVHIPKGTLKYDVQNVNLIISINNYFCKPNSRSFCFKWSSAHANRTPIASTRHSIYRRSRHFSLLTARTLDSSACIYINVIALHVEHSEAISSAEFAPAGAKNASRGGASRNGRCGVHHPTDQSLDDGRTERPALFCSLPPRPSAGCALMYCELEGVCRAARRPPAATPSPYSRRPYIEEEKTLFCHSRGCKMIIAARPDAHTQGALISIQRLNTGGKLTRWKAHGSRMTDALVVECFCLRFVDGMWLLQLSARALFAHSLPPPPPATSSSLIIGSNHTAQFSFQSLLWQFCGETNKANVRPASWCKLFAHLPLIRFGEESWSRLCIYWVQLRLWLKFLFSNKKNHMNLENLVICQICAWY